MTADLLVDIGSSAIKWCLWEKHAVVEVRSILHCDGEYIAELRETWSALPRPVSVWVASVAPKERAADVAALCSEIWRLEVNVVCSEALAFGVVNGYSNPAQLGVDRWLALLGARQRSALACCIVDCGTAATVDALNAKGNHLGGYILPGVGTGRRALLANTQIPRVTDVDPLLPFGRDTASAVALGTRLAIVGVIQRVIAAISDDRSAAELFLTGSEAELLRPWLPGATQWTPNLVFEGLGRYAGRG